MVRNPFLCFEKGSTLESRSNESNEMNAWKFLTRAFRCCMRVMSE